MKKVTHAEEFKADVKGTLLPRNQYYFGAGFYTNKPQEQLLDLEYRLYGDLNPNDALFLNQLKSHFGAVDIIPLSPPREREGEILFPIDNIKEYLTYTNTKAFRYASVRLRRIWKHGLIRRYVKGKWNKRQIVTDCGKWWGVCYKFDHILPQDLPENKK